MLNLNDRFLNSITFNQILPNPDITLEKERANIAIYRRLLYDSRVWSCVKKLIYYLKNFSFRIVSKEKDENARRQVHFFEQMFEQMDFVEPTIMGVILSKFFGYGVGEIIYNNDASIVTAQKINWLPQEWFGFDYLNNLVYFPENQTDHVLVKVFNEPSSTVLKKSYDKYYQAYLKELQEDVLLPYRIILVRQMSDASNPYGEGDASRLFYEVLYRNMAKKYRALNVEKFGLPPLVLKTILKEESLYEAKRMLADSTSGIITVPPESEITPVQVPNETRLMFTTQIEDADRIIQDIILMQSASQDLARFGSRAAVEVFEESAMKGIWSCKKDIEFVANEIIKNICTINGYVVNCYYEMYNDREVDLLEEMEVDRALMDVSGLRFKKQYFIDKYSRNVNDFVPESLSDEPILPPQTPETPPAPEAPDTSQNSPDNQIARNEND